MDYDTLLENVSRERLLDRDEWQFILTHYKTEYRDGGLWIEAIVFLPNSHNADMEICGVFTYTHYWSSSLYDSIPSLAWCFGIRSDCQRMEPIYRAMKKSARLVTPDTAAERLYPYGILD